MIRWILVISFLTSVLAVAQPYRRLVNFEWEPIDGASSYEIEIRKKGEMGKSTAFKSDNPKWNGRLPIGHYEFRLRTLDRRKVPGEWSDYTDLDVMLEPVKIKSPTPQSFVKSKFNNSKSEVSFEWESVPSADKYSIEIKNSKGEVVIRESTSKTSFTKDLPVAQSYSFTVTAVSKTLESEFFKPVSFTLVGPQIEKVKIENPDNEFIRELKWARPEFTENFDVVLAKLNPTTKKWLKFKEYENWTDQTLVFEPDWPGGNYLLQIKAKASVRETSEPSNLSFNVRQGDRSPAAEYVTTMRKSIERTNGWFTHLSWYANSISLNSAYKNALSFGTTSITGTGRVGGGWLDPDKNWGFLAIADMSGFVFEDNVYNFVGLEFSAIRQKQLSDRADIRYHMGVFTKEFPALWTTSNSALANFGNFNNVDRKYSKGNVAGPHIGAEYWYSITPKLGLQANLHLYLPMLGLEFPNGGKLGGTDPNLSLGALGSYRYSNQLTGLVGINYRMESYRYTDSKDASSWLGIDSDSNDTVLTEMNGIFINFMAEYAF
jgi:hypothetical protein